MALELPTSPQYLGFVALYLGAGLVTIGLAAYMYRHHWADRLGKVFALLVLSVAVWILGTVLVSATRFTLDGDLFVAAKLLKFVGVTVAPVLFLVFALLYDGRYRWVSRSGVAGLLVVPAATLAVLATTRLHGWFYDGFGVLSFAGRPAIYVTPGAWFWVSALYSYGLLVVGSCLLLYAGAKRWPYYRFETATVLVGVVLTWATNLAYVIDGWPHPAIDPTPIGFVLMSLLFAVGVFSPRLVDIPVPVRIDVLDAIDDAILVLDSEDRVAAANAGAHELLGDEALSGASADELFPWDRDRTRGGEPTVNEVALDGGNRRFKCRELTIGRESVGWTIVVLTDITEELEAQRLRTQRDTLREQNEKLEVLHQVIRHDIRNDTGTILMAARRLREVVDGEADDSLDAIVARGEHITELTDTTEQLMRTMLERDEEAHPVDLPHVLRREIAAVREVGEDVTVTTPERFPAVAVRADDMLGEVFRNILTNAVEHNDAPESEITVSVAEASTDVTVRIADDGPGVSDGRKRAIFERGERGLDSPGVGLGLYLVDTLVSRYGGDVWVEDNEPRGAVFVVWLPRANHPDATAGLTSTSG